MAHCNIHTPEMFACRLVRDTFDPEGDLTLCIAANVSFVTLGNMLNGMILQDVEDVNLF